MNYCLNFVFYLERLIGIDSLCALSHFKKYKRVSKIVFPYFYSELDAHDSGET